MTTARTWIVEIFIDDHKDQRHTHAEARLHASDKTHLTGASVAMRAIRPTTRFSRSATSWTSAPKAPWAYQRLEKSFCLAVRMAEQAEISTLICWLGPDEAINVNGAIITSDGGGPRDSGLWVQLAVAGGDVVFLTFLGAAGTMTGSRFRPDDGPSILLVDCGMFPGERELGWEQLGNRFRSHPPNWSP